MKKILIYIVLLFYVNTAYGQLLKLHRDITNAKEGVVDLRNANFDKNVFALDGEWEFYWNKLLTPDEIKNQVQSYALVPKFWTKYELNGKTLPSKGYATYHLKVLLPKDNDRLALSFHSIFTSYKLYINGKLIDEVGQVGTNPQTSKPSWLPKTNIFHTHSDTLDIVIQVSNFHHYRAGITKQIVLGTPDKIYDYNLLGLGYEAFIIGALLIMALYHLFLFYHRKTDLSALYLSLTLITQSILTGLDGEYILVRLLPNLNWFFEVNLLYVLLYYRSVVFAFFVYYISKEFSRKVLIAVTIWGSVMTFFVLATPPTVFTQSLDVFIIGGFLIILYTFYIMIKSIKYQIGTAYASIGTLILLITALNDALYDLGYIHTFYMLGLGLFVFILTQAMMLAIHSGRMHQHILIYSMQLKIMNKLKEELIKIPFYESDKSLKIITQIFKATRGVFIENKHKKLIITNEVSYNQTKKLNLPLDEAGNSFICKRPIIAATKSNTIITLHRDSKKNKRKNKALKKRISNENYLESKQIDSMMIAPIYQKGDLKAVLYFEKTYGYFKQIYVKILEASLGQIASLLANAESYQQLQNINEKLELLVQKRTNELQSQNKELLSKNRELQDKIEELQAYNEQLNMLNNQLEAHKYEIESKNSSLEKLQVEIIKQKSLVEDQYKKITESIQFAKKVQTSILNQEVELPFSEYFILYLPKQIVSGDFYWFKRFEDKFVIVVADCTGHGVPGAFMSILAAAFLTDITHKYYIEQQDFDVTASQILDDLRGMVISYLSEHSHDNIKDGMDVALIIYDERKQEINYSGAYNPLWLIRDEQLIEFKADRQPIGVHYKGIMNPFTDYNIKLKEGDWLYMFTDGYADQFNVNGEKFYKKRFKELILKIHKNKAGLQKEKLLKEFMEWKKGYFQIDDILIVGIKV